MAGIDRAVDLVRSRGGAARLVVLRDGQPVLDHTQGCAPDALFWLFSVSKPYVALLVHLLAERGLLDLDDPVAAHWPEYGQRGKETITVRHVLSHRAGVPLASGSLLGDAAAMADWSRAVRQAERARPRWPAGTVPAYHILTFGFILGELIRRVTGVEPDELLRTEILEPLGLHDTYLRLPADARGRAVPLAGRGGPGEAGFAMLFNRPRVRRAIIPATSVSATAHDVARLYQALLDRTGPLTPTVVSEATRVSSDGELDRQIRQRMRWGHGFQLAGAPGNDRPMGTLAGPETFGHNGSGTCLAWADPRRRLVAVYLTGVVTNNRRSRAHQSAVSDAVLRGA
jgi:CubicO group peptidase (beta-lactamase class C family)